MTSSFMTEYLLTQFWANLNHLIDPFMELLKYEVMQHYYRV